MACPSSVLQRVVGPVLPVFCREWYGLSFQCTAEWYGLSFQCTAEWYSLSFLCFAESGMACPSSVLQRVVWPVLPVFLQRVVGPVLSVFLQRVV